MKPEQLVDDIIGRLEQVLPASSCSIPLHEPSLKGNEWAYVKQSLDTGWVSSAGGFVEQFEAQLAAYTGAGYAVAVVNGTAALHLCLRLAGVEPGDEVIVPALTFVATANAVSYCGAVPHLADSSELTLGIDPFKLEAYLDEVAVLRDNCCRNRVTGRRMKALVAVHTLGHPAEPERLQQLCRRYRLEFVEDAAESLGSYYKGQHTGTWGTLSALSFNGNKIITAGGGGAVLTNDESLARECKHLTTTAKLAHRWAFQHDRIGHNYRMPGINAALGTAQLEQLAELRRRKRVLAAAYASVFAGCEGLRFFLEPPDAESNYWLNALVLAEENEAGLEPLLEQTHSKGWNTRPLWTPLHLQPMYAGCPRMDVSTAESLARRILTIPSSADLGGEHD
ncbi:LegC family aminotransferase [Paenibacillus sp. y28]|uniref:LegC family aminotransferase n=1 Tax=Paenibacillus sp. y28 TaxID=3129110 RepID=UPI003015EDFD